MYVSGLKRMKTMGRCPTCILWPLHESFALTGTTYSVYWFSLACDFITPFCLALLVNNIKHSLVSMTQAKQRLLPFNSKFWYFMTSFLLASVVNNNEHSLFLMTWAKHRFFQFKTEHWIVLASFVLTSPVQKVNHPLLLMTWAKQILSHWKPNTARFLHPSFWHFLLTYLLLNVSNNIKAVFHSRPNVGRVPHVSVWHFLFLTSNIPASWWFRQNKGVFVEDWMLTISYTPCFGISCCSNDKLSSLKNIFPGTFHQISGMLNGGEILETEVRELIVFHLYLSKTLYYIVKSWPNKQTKV